jgi:hypothetical protein
LAAASFPRHFVMLCAEAFGVNFVAWEHSSLGNKIALTE